MSLPCSKPGMALRNYIIKFHICRLISKVPLDLVSIIVPHILNPPIIPNWTILRYIEAHNITIELLILSLPLQMSLSFSLKMLFMLHCLIPYHDLRKAFLVPRLGVLLSQSFLKTPIKSMYFIPPYCHLMYSLL